jgi:DNA-binding MarR family transcriptional regulator
MVRVFYRSVSESIAHIYTSKFNLSVSEWRVLVVLGTTNVFSASEIVERSSVTKVNVSRATKNLQKRGLLKRDINGSDKRRAALRLTAEGKEIYTTLVPLVTALEEELLEGLTQEEFDTLLSLMSKIQLNAESVIASNAN